MERKPSASYLASPSQLCAGICYDATWQEHLAPQDYDPFQGTMTICSQGCADCILLVITGEERGRLVSVGADWNPPVAATSGELKWTTEISPYDDERGNGSYTSSTQTLTEFLREGPYQGPPLAIVEAMLAHFQAKKPSWFDAYRLQVAVSCHDQAAIRGILAQGVPADTPVRGLTPFYFAVLYAERDLAETLFAAGVDVNRKFPFYQETILMLLVNHAPDAS